MPRKSWRSQDKRLSHSKKRKVTLARATQQQPAPQTHKPVPHPSVSSPLASVPTPTAALTVTQNSYITAELRRIGILTGIILAIIVVLALVLS